VLFAVPQTESGGLAPGDPFTLTIPTSGASLVARGALTALSPAQDTATDARAVEGRVTGDATGLLPGMSGIVDIATGAKLPAFSVPSTALNDSTLGPYLFVLTPGKPADTLATVYVTIYGSGGGDTLVSTAGLAAGEQIVALGGFKLTDGASVTPQSQ
jgi:multidrug efflux pump subunit AcrA (membrane-fusion protein)